MTYSFNLTGYVGDAGDTVAIGGTTVATSATDAAGVITAATTTNGGVWSIGGVNYTATSTVSNILVLTSSSTTAAATLAYTATDIAPVTTGFNAGAGNTTPVAKANGVAEVFTIAFGTSGAIEDGDTIVFNGQTITLASGDTAANIATKVAAGTYTNWTGVVTSSTSVQFTNKATGTQTDVAQGTAVAGDFTITNITSATTMAAITASVTTQGAIAGAGVAALTIDKMASGGTLELTATGAGAIVKVTNAATGAADVLNVVTKAAGDLGTVTAADVETINLNVTDADTGITTLGWNDANGNFLKTANVSTTTLAVEGTANTKTINVEGAGNLILSLAAANTKVSLVDGSTATGKLTLDLSARNGDAVTVKGGLAADVLTASAGANGHADVLIGGAGNDTLNAGSNGAKLTGGEGNDLFVVAAASKEANTYTSILDFQAGDVLDLTVTGTLGFAKLTATLSESTSVFSNFVDAAIAQATTGNSVWFTFASNAYVVVDNAETNAAPADKFQNGVDTVVQLVGIDLANASYNSTNGTIALV